MGCTYPRWQVALQSVAKANTLGWLACPLVAEIRCALIVHYRFSAECILSLIEGLWPPPPPPTHTLWSHSWPALGMMEGCVCGEGGGWLSLNTLMCIWKIQLPRPSVCHQLCSNNTSAFRMRVLIQRSPVRFWAWSQTAVMDYDEASIVHLTPGEVQNFPKAVGV